jgi:hypothetical protein
VFQNGCIPLPTDVQTATWIYASQVENFAINTKKFVSTFSRQKIQIALARLAQFIKCTPPLIEGSAQSDIRAIRDSMGGIPPGRDL